MTEAWLSQQKKLYLDFGVDASKSKQSVEWNHYPLVVSPLNNANIELGGIIPHLMWQYVDLIRINGPK